LGKAADEDVQDIIDKSVEIAHQKDSPLTAAIIKQASNEIAGAKNEPVFLEEAGEYEDVKDASIVTDEFGRPIPKKLKEKQALKAPLVALAAELNSIKSKVEEFYDRPGGEFLERQKIRDQIASLKYDISKAGYLTECPGCSGASCSTCDGAGFIPVRMKGSLSTAQKEILGI
jgi:hypothetical protein